MKEFIVYENKNKVLRVLVSSFILVMASVFVLYLGYTEPSLTYRAIGGAGLIFFGYSGVFLCKRTIIAFKYPQKAVLVKVCAEGVFDFSSKSSKGLIKWEEITSVKASRSYNQQNIIMELRPKSNLQSKVRKVHMNINTSDVSLSDLLAVIEKGLKN